MPGSRGWMVPHHEEPTLIRRWNLKDRDCDALIMQRNIISTIWPMPSWMKNYEDNATWWENYCAIEGMRSRNENELFWSWIYPKVEALIHSWLYVTTRERRSYTPVANEHKCERHTKDLVLLWSTVVDVVSKLNWKKLLIYILRHQIGKKLREHPKAKAIEEKATGIWDTEITYNAEPRWSGKKKK